MVKRGRAAGLTTGGFYNALGTHTPDGYVFEVQSHEDVRTMDDRLLERGGIRHPSGVDLATMFHQQGIVNLSAKNRKLKDGDLICSIRYKYILPHIVCK